VRPCADRTTPPDVESSHAWLLSVWLLVAAFLALALVESARVGIPLRDPGGAVFLSRIAISAGIFVPLAVIDAWCRTNRGRRDRRTVVATLRGRWPRRRLLLAASGLLAYYVVYFSYHNLKSWDVLNSPRDTMLLAWDRWLFLGHSPAGLLHDLLGTHVAAYVLMGIYESFSTLVTVAVVASMVLPTRIREGYVFIASSLWVWILGVGSYYLIPSLGPFDSDPAQFADLPHTMVQDTQVRYLGQRAHLLAHPQAGDAFAQVSAFASLHVAVTCLLLLMARYYGLRRASYALAVFLAGTIVATVYLGWHFVVDDIAGLLIAVVGVALGRLMVQPREVR
jgi:membrane-associated phospholipid phosphatase